MSAGRWAVYLRISRTDDRLGVERQLDDCRLTLATMGVTEADIELYDENNTSATKGLDKRPEYRRLVAEIKAGRIAGVMVWKQDRLARDPDELSAFMKLGTRLATSASGEFNLNDSATRKAIRDAGSTAQFEVDQISDRVSAASAQRAKAGKAHGRAPFGWRREVAISRGRVVDSWDELDEAEAGLIRHAASELIAGKSIRSIVAELNEGDVRPRDYVFTKGRHAGRVNSKVWTTTQLRTLLLRGSNAGLRTYKGEILEGVVAEWPAILDLRTYNQVRLVFADPSRRTNERGVAPRWLLSGLASCSECADGGKINVATGGKRNRPVYVCVGNPGSRGCFQRHWIEDVDDYVGELVEARLADPAFSEAPPEAEAEIVELEARILELRGEQAEAGKLKAARKITLGQLVEINAGIDADVAALEDKIKALRPVTLNGVELPDGWAGADLATRRAVVRRLFASITLVPSTVHGKLRTYDTIDEEVVAKFR